MKKKQSHEQFDLFGTSTAVIEPKKKRNIISEEEREHRKEKSEAHRAWKLLKSIKGKHLLTEKDKFLLQKYYGVKL